MVEILQLLHEIRSFPEVLFKIGDLKNLSTLQVNTRSSHPEVLCKKMFLKILQNSQKKCLCWSPFLTKLQAGNLKLSETATRDVL